MKRYFITGTDTDCGKTYVTCILLDHLKKAQAIKPIASGVIRRDDAWVNEDILYLQQHNLNPAQPINGWLYPEPIAPHLAAKRHGETLSASDVARFCDSESFSNYEHLLIEGAGGLMVPLNDKETWLDVIQLLAIPVLLVVGIRLGCINHALLTEAVLKQERIACAGWIANCLDKDMALVNETIDTLSSRLSSPLIATVAFGGSFHSSYPF
jgi:dethiobiotin synthetase